MRRHLLVLFILFSTFGILTTALEAARPRHCFAIGPLNDPDYCGCTWGRLYVDGKEIADVPITLTFADQSIATDTAATAIDPTPYYHLEAWSIGARKGDLIVASAEFNGEVYSQTYTAFPEADFGEQQINLTVPQLGKWELVSAEGYTRTVTYHNSQLWAGGTGGARIVGGTTYALPSVRQFASQPNGALWASGIGVHSFDGNSWTTHSPPVAGPYYAMSATDDTVYVSAFDGGQGVLLAYNGNSWATVETFQSVIMGIAVTANGSVWVGTFEHGVFEQTDAHGWTQYTAADGLASNIVWSAIAQGNAVYFGTEPYFDGTYRGGISRVDNGVWTTWGIDHGLTADTAFPQSTATIYGLTAGADGTLWAATEQGVASLGSSGYWQTPNQNLSSNRTFAIAHGDTIYATTINGLNQLNQAATVGSAPAASIDTVAFDTHNFVIIGSGGDTDESNLITAYEWRIVETDQLLCNNAACTLPYLHISLPMGQFTLSLRVQDDEGMRSSAITQTIQNQVPLAISLQGTSAKASLTASIELLVITLLFFTYRISYIVQEKTKCRLPWLSTTHKQKCYLQRD